MSRLTSAQVIELGHYLQPDFEPSTLTVAQLLGIFGYHNIAYPSQYTKPKLIQVFEEQIKPRASKLKRERIKHQNSAASDEGIIDGITGEPIGRPAVRRSSRRSSRAPSEDVDRDTSPVRPEPKRRRSSAQPSLGGPSRKSTAARKMAPVVIEESEPEESEDEEVPARKVGRRKKTGDDAAARARRVSGPDSGWEDNNIFQSGAESSSPVRPSPTKLKTRKSSVQPRKTRKSTSAPPQFSPPSSPDRQRQAQDDHPIPLSPLQRRFAPELPESIIEENTLISPPKSRRAGRISAVFNGPLVAEEGDLHDLSFADDGPSIMEVKEMVPVEEVEEVEESETVSSLEKSVKLPTPSADEAFAVEVSRRMAEGDKNLIRLPPGALIAKPWSTARWIMTLVTFSLTFLSMWSYKIESAKIGYCDAGRNTSAILDRYHQRLSAVEACNRDNTTHLHLPGTVLVGDSTPEPCPAPPLTPLLDTVSCTPCPEHATCNHYTVVCDAGNILKSSPLFFLLPPVKDRHDLQLRLSSPPADVIWKIISYALDGWPGFGSVAFPPRCVRDPKRDLHIGALGKVMQRTLTAQHKSRLCSGHQPPAYAENEGGEPRRWGLSSDELKALHVPKSADLQSTYDGVFEEAIQQLVQFSDIDVREGPDGMRYLSVRNPPLGWTCALKVKSKETLYEVRGYLIAAFVIALSILGAKNKYANLKIENQRVAELVQVALDSLRNQELAHHTDPVTAPQAYLSSIQLRDLILQEEHSVNARKKLWDKVDAIVEANTNVRTNLEETSGGDELRVWRWVGASGGTPRGVARRKMLFQGARHPASPGGEEEVSGEED